MVYNHVTTLKIWKNSTAEDNITKFCTLLESKRPKQYTTDARSFKFGLQSENNGLRPKTKFDPQNGRAYDHVTTFAISEIVTYLRLMLQSSNFVCCQISLVLSIKWNLTPKWAWLMVTWPLSKFQKNPHISGMAQGRILKLGLLSEINRPMWYTKFNPWSGRGLWSRDH